MWAVHRRLDRATQRNGLIATWGRLVPTIASWHMWGIVNRKSNVSRLGDDDKAESLEVLVLDDALIERRATLDGMMIVTGRGSSIWISKTIIFPQ
jgi:hypothetical protein